MEKPDPQWYKKIWSLDIKDMSWVEETFGEIDFVAEILELGGTERILDLACGFGRHSLELARRGFEVVGVDITAQYIAEAKRLASLENLDAVFVCADLRDVHYANEFDVVLNMADGAIGYLENDTENLKIFDLVASALKPGGKHFMNICNREHAETHFPKRHWVVGSASASFPEFDWDSENSRMLYGGWGARFGETLQKPASTAAHSSTRLYSIPEMALIFKSRGMAIAKTYGAFDRQIPASHREMQLLVYSQKNREA
jgi:SAM-dependent methyltransferase